MLRRLRALPDPNRELPRLATHLAAHPKEVAEIGMRPLVERAREIDARLNAEDLA